MKKTLILILIALAAITVLLNAWEANVYVDNKIQLGGDDPDAYVMCYNATIQPYYKNIEQYEFEGPNYGHPNYVSAEVQWRSYNDRVIQAFDYYMEFYLTIEDESIPDDPPSGN